ncbi:unnamed protein product [Mytilus coruscus]|uniref:C17orf113 probable zinc finger domain-containing protein n=1 Tax=Mytilus coruscus TaxID=42192 RepID=A0A6J8AJ88_MYTCO|nr:unnamed protein product [Mytilus coruscus]
MNCITCEKFAVTDLDKKCIFVTGSSNFKLDSVLAHEQSEQHKKSTGIKEKKATEELKGRENHSNFKSKHFQKNRRPFTDFLWMCELDKMKGVDIGQTYRNDKQVVTFVNFIAKVERQNVVNYINESRTRRCGAGPVYFSVHWSGWLVYKKA